MTLDHYADIRYPPWEDIVAEIDGGEQAIIDELLDREIATFRDIQYIYGKLYALATGGTGYQQYCTPDQARDILGEENSLVVADVDITGDTPTIESVETLKYTEDLIEKVAHSHYDTGRGADFSITHRTGADSTPESVAGDVQERFDRWAQKDTVREVAETHPDGHILRALEDLGRQTEVMDDLKESVTELLVEQGVEETTALVTARVRVDPDGDFLWPGDVDVLQAAMKETLFDKYATKNADDSRGDGTCFVTGEEGEVVGTQMDPMGYYLTKQQEFYEGLNTENAWRQNGVSPETANAVNDSVAFLESCWTTSLGSGSGDSRVNIYWCPYFRTLDAEHTRALYDVLTLMAATEMNDEFTDATPLATLYEKKDLLDGVDQPLQFAIVVEQETDGFARDEILTDKMHVEQYRPSEIASTHLDLLTGPLFKDNRNSDDRDPDGEWIAPFPRYENEEDRMELWQTTNTAIDFLQSVITTDYFQAALPTQTEDSIDAPHLVTYLQALAGDTLSVDKLLEQVDAKIRGASDPIPEIQIIQSYLLIETLAAVDALHAGRDQTEALTTASTMPTQEFLEELKSIDDRTERRHRRLEEFLETHQQLDDTQRRGAFLTGYLVGHLSRVQQAEGKSQTIARTHYPGNVTKHNIPRVLNTALEKNMAYSDDYGQTGTMFQEATDRLEDIMLDEHPEDWTLTNSDLRMFYGLGITYGRNYYDELTHEGVENEEEKEPPATEEADQGGEGDDAEIVEQ
jgi:hypothetical protein